MAKTFEERLETKYIRHLRKEISKLKRENQQLRKKVRRQEYELIESQEPDPEIQYTETTNKTKERLECEKCGSYDVMQFRSGAFDFYKCTCGSKGRVSKANKAS